MQPCTGFNLVFTVQCYITFLLPAIFTFPLLFYLYYTFLIFPYPFLFFVGRGECKAIALQLLLTDIWSPGYLLAWLFFVSSPSSLTFIVCLFSHSSSPRLSSAIRSRSCSDSDPLNRRFQPAYSQDLKKSLFRLSFAHTTCLSVHIFALFQSGYSIQSS